MRPFGNFDFVTRLGRGFRLALVGGTFCLVPLAAPSLADDIASSVAEEGTRESSVVVATRKLTAEEMIAEEGEGLQPITISDKEPRLADPDGRLGPPGTSAAAKTAVKVASNTIEVDAEVTTDESTEASAPRPAVFHGIQPGVSTKKQLIDAWGSPEEVGPTETGQLMMFKLESFRGVEVLVENGLVTLMKITLHAPTAPEQLAEKIAADPSEAVKVTDPESGRVAAYAYPERGIVMVVAEPDDITPESTERVSEMLLQPLDAETFCLRAEQRSYGEFTNRITDLKQAVTLAPREAHAHWLLSRALSDAGQVAEALSEAKLAVEIEGENMAYREQLARALAAAGQYDEAVLATRQVLDAQNVPTLVRARALHQMGMLAAMGDAEISSKAMGFQNMAITEADKLATSDNATDRREAKRILVEAHLAIATDVAERETGDNMDNVAQWASRASAFAEELIENDEGDLGLRIRVAEQALDALANFKPSNDPAPLIKEIEDTLEQIKTQSPDPLWIDQLEWTTGVAYQHALEIEHHRRRPKQALEYSEKAIKLMADQAEERRSSPATERVVGKLYFHIGAVHAVHQSEHAEAIKWYDRAYPLLVSDAPQSELLVPRHEGEALVSMAVSYWDQKDEERAISLTEKGADLIEQAVTGGVIEKQNLAVPYGNLAAMHKKLGNLNEAQRYAKLVESVKVASDTEAAPKANNKVQAKTNPAAGTASTNPQRRMSTANNTQQRPTGQRVMKR
jgi:tetratricopeptide (TPR) repeat protein